MPSSPVTRFLIRAARAGGGGRTAVYAKQGREPYVARPWLAPVAQFCVPRKAAIRQMHKCWQTACKPAGWLTEFNHPIRLHWGLLPTTWRTFVGWKGHRARSIIILFSVLLRQRCIVASHFQIV